MFDYAGFKCGYDRAHFTTVIRRNVHLSYRNVSLSGALYITVYNRLYLSCCFDFLYILSLIQRLSDDHRLINRV